MVFRLNESGTEPADGEVAAIEAGQVAPAAARLEPGSTLELAGDEDQELGALLEGLECGSVGAQDMEVQ